MTKLTLHRSPRNPTLSAIKSIVYRAIVVKGLGRAGMCLWGGIFLFGGM